MMRCHEIQPLLSEWLDEELEEASAQDVAAHLDSCSECLGRLEELEAPSRALRDMVPSAAPPLSSISGLIGAGSRLSGVHSGSTPKWRQAAS